MTNDELDALVKQRFEDWRPGFAIRHCVPVLAIGLGLDDHAGTIDIVAVSDLDDTTLATICTCTANILLARARKGSHGTTH